MTIADQMAGTSVNDRLNKRMKRTEDLSNRRIAFEDDTANRKRER